MNKAKCKMCKWHGDLWGEIICEFAIRTHQLRGCNKGECTRFKLARAEDGRVKKGSWDHVKALEMWKDGAIDRVIAEACEVSPNTIAAWRKRNKLRPNRRKYEQATCDPAGEGDSGLSAPPGTDNGREDV